MALREFTDENGVAWRVWETIPEGGGALRGDFRFGWLTFESADERRRLSPVPAGWSLISDARLAMLGRLAEPVAVRSTARTERGPVEDDESAALDEAERESRQ